MDGGEDDAFAQPWISEVVEDGGEEGLNEQGAELQKQKEEAWRRRSLNGTEIRL